MALILCPECKKEISDRASVCIHCGFPIAEYLSQNGSVSSDTSVPVRETESIPDTCAEIFDKLYFESKCYLLSGSGKKRFLKHFPIEMEEGQEVYQPVHWDTSKALEAVYRELEDHLLPLAPNTAAYSAYVDHLIHQLYERKRWYSFDNRLFENVIWDTVNFKYVSEETMDHIMTIIASAVNDGEPAFEHLTILIDKMYDNGTRRQEQELSKMMKKFQFALQLRTFHKYWQMLLEPTKRSVDEWKDSHTS